MIFQQRSSSYGGKKGRAREIRAQGDKTRRGQKIHETNDGEEKPRQIAGKKGCAAHIVGEEIIISTILSEEVLSEEVLSEEIIREAIVIQAIAGEESFASRDVGAKEDGRDTWRSRVDRRTQQDRSKSTEEARNLRKEGSEHLREHTTSASSPATRSDSRSHGRVHTRAATSGTG